MDVKVSVIIPCYNAENTIRESIISLESQEVKPYEVICIDDGSTDNTANIIEAMKNESILNIRLFSQKNSGVSVARNRGIEESVGAVLLFLDADDMYNDAFIKDISTAYYLGYDTSYGRFTHNIKDFNKKFVAKAKIEQSRYTMQRDFMYQKGRYHTSAFSYKRELLDSNAIRFTPGAKYGEDWEMTTKYLDACSKGLELYNTVMFYRLSGNSAMKRISYNHVDAIESAMRTEEYLCNVKSDFTEAFSLYMKHRAIFSVAHNFSKHSECQYFTRLLKQYDVKSSMRMLARNKNVGISVRMAATSFLVSPWLFYYISGRR